MTQSSTLITGQLNLTAAGRLFVSVSVFYKVMYRYRGSDQEPRGTPEKKLDTANVSARLCKTFRHHSGENNKSTQHTVIPDV